MSYGWKLVISRTEKAKSFDLPVNLCKECYNAKFPYAIIYDGEEGNCPHLFALKAKEEL